MAYHASFLSYTTEYKESTQQLRKLALILTKENLNQQHFTKTEIQSKYGTEFKRLLKASDYEPQQFDTEEKLISYATQVLASPNGNNCDVRIFYEPDCIQKINQTFEHRARYGQYSEELRTTIYKEEILNLTSSIAKLATQCAHFLLLCQKSDRDRLINLVHVTSLKTKILKEYKTLESNNSDQQGPTSQNSYTIWSKDEESPTLSALITNLHQTTECFLSKQLYPLKLKGEMVPLDIEFAKEVLQRDNDRANPILNLNQKQTLLNLIESELAEQEHISLIYHIANDLQPIPTVSNHPHSPLYGLHKLLINPFTTFHNQISSNYTPDFLIRNPQLNQIYSTILSKASVSDLEIEYLKEKAHEAFVPQSEIDNFFQKPIAFRSIQIFIDQITEDGIITSTERDFITDKAREFRIPDNQLNNLIEQSLIQSIVKNQLLESSKYYPLILTFIVWAYFAKEQRVMNWIIQDLFKEHTPTYNPEYVELAFQFMCDDLNIPTGSASDIFDLLKHLGIEHPTYDHAYSLQETTISENQIKQSNTPDQKVSINGQTYNVKFLRRPLSPLFNFERLDGNYQLDINTDHPLIGQLDLNTLSLILCTMLHTRNNFSDNAGDLFVSKIKTFIDLID